jgi:SAM-dependent methyltransferase
MRGFVPTPDVIVDHMVASLFDGRPPSENSRILDPGCGPGAFIEGVIRWCQQRGVTTPRITGVELDPTRHDEATAKFRHHKSITITKRDFLTRSSERFDYVIGNPPYVSITHLSETEKAAFRDEYATARGRFDLYLLFFEQALRLLETDGRLVFITPEKFLYVKTAQPLRKMLAQLNVKEIDLVDEETFGALVTYPTITTVDNASATHPTKVVLRNGATRTIHLPVDGASLLPLMNGRAADRPGPTLADISVRVSCGVATGADGIFVQPMAGLDKGLTSFAYPTISGRQLVPGQEHVESEDAMLVPYDARGRLLPLESLGALADYLSTRERRRHLGKRVCARRKPWHAFHDSVPLDEILRPKLLCKDITEEPGFWLDRTGTLVPRHSVYFIVPMNPSQLDEIAAYLNSKPARSWMMANCQRAANDFIRLQSAVLKRLPVPEALARGAKSLSTRKTVARARQAALVLSR